MTSPEGERITIDTGTATVTVACGDSSQTWPMASQEAFDAASKGWLRCGWDVKHLYSFTWLGRPMLQLPEDMIRFQELIWVVRPDVIIETGVAHGGSLVFSASICRLLGKGRVIGVERGLYPENKKAIEDHTLSDLMTVIEGSSVDPEVVDRVKSQVSSGETVMVLLDSNHSYAHVLEELRAYGPLISEGSYIIACDGIIADLVGAPRSEADWTENNAMFSARDYAKENADFEVVDPEFLFNESLLHRGSTYWKGGILKRNHRAGAS